MKRQITDDLEVLLGVLPPDIQKVVKEENNTNDLLEIILDLGRVPTARLVDGEVVLSEQEIQQADIDHVVEGLGDFDADNRAGIERTLHRISAIRNRRGSIVGLTLRVGRAVYGTIDIIEDLIAENKSMLMLGRPGVGKTTMLRELARILAETKRVVIVDTSNEIGGDGDVPHPAVGRARRMQVATPSLQHEVMIEAVENHNPEVIVIDEIGREMEAAAARTIAERGVQLIGTAHGNELENLMLNPTLSDLIGGIESVTISDDEARRRGTQKTVLERRSPPTFDLLVEIQTRDRVAVHNDVASAVDSLLRGYPLPAEIRSRDEEGKITVTKAPTTAPSARKPTHGAEGPRRSYRDGPERGLKDADRKRYPEYHSMAAAFADREAMDPIRIYPYGVAQNRLRSAAQRLGVPAVFVKDVSEAQVLVTLRNYYRKRQRTVIDAEHRGMPVYVLRSNTVNQMERFLGNLFNLSSNVKDQRNVDKALEDAQAAINAVLNGERWVDLNPNSSFIRRLQHEMVKDAKLISHSYGKEPNRRVRVYRE